MSGFGEVDSNDTNIISQAETGPDTVPDLSTGEVISPIDTVTTNPDAPFNQYVNFFGYMATGPLGPRFNTIGNSESQVYLPLYNPDYPSVYPPTFPWRDVHEFVQTFLAGLPFGSTAIESLFSDDVVRRFVGYSVAEIERYLGVFIQRRQIICNAGMRGFIYGQDYDLEEREYDYDAQEFYNWG